MRALNVMFSLLTITGISTVANATTDTVNPQSAAQTNPMEDPNRMVCKRYESTGSRLHGGQICHSVQEWNAIRHLSELQVEKSSNAAAVAKIPPSSH
jgi:hypothetical protein